MQAVKWRIAFFYFDMNIFKSVFALRKLSIEAPSCPNDLTMDSPRIYSIAEPDISSMAWCVIAAVFSLCLLIPCKANEEKATPTTEITAAAGLRKRKHRRIAINFAYPLMMISTIFIPCNSSVDSSVVTPVRISPTLFWKNIPEEPFSAHRLNGFAALRLLHNQCFPATPPANKRVES